MSKEKTVAIHQPNFLPWLGYFHKMAQSDAFIILDNVQVQKTGGSYTNRVQLAIAGSPQWVTIPIERNYHGTKAINEIKINYREYWQEKLFKTLQSNYARAVHFEETFTFLQSVLSFKTEFLSEFNIHGIKAIQKALSLDNKETLLASTIPTSASSTELLTQLTRACDGTIYLSGGGASGYQEEDLFSKAGIKLQFQTFKHPIYDQKRTPFLPGLSIVDAVMHLGWKATREILQ